jgi:chromatin remodeling complex protein RSC6
MARKNTKQIKEEETSDSEVEEKPVVKAEKKGKAKKEKAPKEEKPKKEKASKKSKKEEEKPASDDETPAEPKTRKPRRVVTAADVDQSFVDLISLLENEIEDLRENKKGAGSARFVRKVKTEVRRLKTDASKLSTAKKPRVKREGTTNCGFTRPTPISDDLADFLKNECDVDIERGGEIPRNDVTSAFYNYFKTKKLSDENDGRIIHPNKKLSKLLNYNEDTADKKLTYFYLQTLLKPHYIKREA